MRMPGQRRRFYVKDFAEWIDRLRNKSDDVATLVKQYEDGDISLQHFLKQLLVCDEQINGIYAGD